MKRLSTPLEKIKSHYDVVVIGSGYGGSISASRLSRAGFSVALLERGKEFLPGEFPDTLEESTREMQADTEFGHVGNPTGLYDFRVNKEVNVFQGCGLGGTSLVNANVSLEADTRILQDKSWPSEIRGNAQEFEKYYNIARDMLKANPYPGEINSLKKLAAHEKSSQFLKQDSEWSHLEFKKTPINVNFEDKVNHVGVSQKACVLCGDCVTGCNHTSKNTTQMNYLPDAKNHGAEIFCQANVHYVEKAGGNWIVHFQPAAAGREKFKAPPLSVSAKLVVVSAGTLGSTEILLRSRQHGLNTSSQLGKKFTGNGDILGFCYNADEEINGIGFGDKEPESMDAVGPCISSVIDARKSPAIEEGFVLEEGSIPGALGKMLAGAFAAGAKAVGKDTDSGFKDRLQEKWRESLGLLMGPYKGAVDNTQTYLIMSHDGSDGELVLEKDRVRVKWPRVGDRQFVKRDNRAMENAAKALGGTFVKNPITNELLNNQLVTVHPLGGCPMAQSASDGVVNHKGQVFCDSEGTDVYEGLYVSDGAIIPRSLGVNPLLTICALSERICEHIAQDYGKSFNYDFTHTDAKFDTTSQKLGVKFTEKMKGYFSADEKSDFSKGFELGKASPEKGYFEFVLTIVSRDVEKMVSEPGHRASILGTVIAPSLSPEPLTASDGLFQLFVKDEKDPNTRYMKYKMTLHSAEGKEFFFDGYKVVRDDKGFDMWEDTTTLYITVFEEDKKTVVGKGILKIAPADFMKQITTVQAVNAKGLKDKAKAVATFSAFFSKEVLEIYT